MRLLPMLLAMALLGALSACKPSVPPTCWPQDARNVPHGAGQVAALADARQRYSALCSGSRQCNFQVHADAAGEITVAADSAFVTDGNVCGFPMDATKLYVYTKDGVFVRDLGGA